MEKQWPTWLVSYGYEGKQWSMEVVAPTHEDAMKRLAAAAAWGKMDGELVATIPAAAGGFLVPLAVWFRNLFVR